MNDTPILIHAEERRAGLHDRANTALRVRWVNHLRTIVSTGCPHNKIGVPLVSDIDLILATPEQRTEALRKTLAHSKP